MTPEERAETQKLIEEIQREADAISEIPACAVIPRTRLWKWTEFLSALIGNPPRREPGDD